MLVSMRISAIMAPSKAARRLSLEREKTQRTPAASGVARSDFLRARLASAVAVLPLGIWTFAHLWNNLAAFEGDEAWQRAVTEYPHPMAEAASAVVVLLPLAIHTIWGIGRLASSRPNNRRYGFYPNLKYVLHRVAAVGVLFFPRSPHGSAFLHPRSDGPSRALLRHPAHEMHFHRPTLIVYLLGTLGVSYHLANGLQTFCMGWGIVSSSTALRRLEWLTILVFAALLGMSWSVVYALYVAGGPAVGS